MTQLSQLHILKRATAEAVGTALLLATVVGSGTFAGIRPMDAPWFIAAQIVGATLATLLFRWLVPGEMSVHEIPEDPLDLDPKESR